MTENELRIQTLNEMVSKTITENIELVVKVKELHQIICEMQAATEILNKSYEEYKRDASRKLAELELSLLQNRKEN